MTLPQDAIPISELKKKMPSDAIKLGVSKIGKPYLTAPDPTSNVNIPLETAKGTLKTIGRSAGRAAKSLGSAVIHPAQTIKGLVDMSTSLSPIRMAYRAMTGARDKTGLENLINHYQNKYEGLGNAATYYSPIRIVKRGITGKDDGVQGNDIPNFAKTISEDPFGFILDVSIIAGTAGSIMRKAGKASKISALEKAGTLPTATQAIKKTGEIVKSSKIYKKAFPTNTYRTNLAIDNGITKAIRPSVVGKKTAPQRMAYTKNSRDAVKTIVENKNGLRFTDELGETVNRLPQNLDEFSQAIQQTKTQIYKYYDELLQSAGEQKGTVSLSNISNKLDDVINSKTLQIKEPGIIKYAQGVKARLNAAGKLGVREADDLIKTYNNSLQAFYKNPSYDLATKASVDSLIVNNLRSSLDDVVSTITGKQFQRLKSKYGALKSIERDINRRAIVAGRQNVKGLIDFTDIFSAGDVIGGITGLSPARISKGIAQMGIKNIFKKLNDPNNIVKDMFKRVDKLYDPVADIITPELMSRLPVNMQKAITMSQRQKQIGLQTKLLPAPKDVPFAPRGTPTATRKLITPAAEGTGVIPGQAPYTGTTLPAVSPNPRVKLTFEEIQRILKTKQKKGGILRSKGMEKVNPKAIIEK